MQPQLKAPTEPLHPRLAALADSLATPEMLPLRCEILQRSGVELGVCRLDAIHPQLGGNKWFKLKYNLDRCLKTTHRRLLTFGGAWSNHIHATAAAGHALGIDTIGIIRGEDVANPNLAFARAHGMRLHFIDRASYRDKHDAGFITSLRQRFGEFVMVPEGGSNELAHRGIAEMAALIEDDCDIVCCAVGTGSTLAGLADALPATQRALGFAVLKAGDSLQQQVSTRLQTSRDNWRIEQDYHFGGYARIDAELIAFLRAFEDRFAIQTDAVYTAKMFYGLFDLLRSGHFDRGTRILALHTGGCQGNAGFSERLRQPDPARLARHAHMLR